MPVPEPTRWGQRVPPLFCVFETRLPRFLIKSSGLKGCSCSASVTDEAVGSDAALVSGGVSGLEWVLA